MQGGRRLARSQPVAERATRYRPTTLSANQREVVDRIVRGFMRDSMCGDPNCTDCGHAGIERTMQAACRYIAEHVRATATTRERAERLGVPFLSRADRKVVLDVAADEINVSIS